MAYSEKELDLIKSRRMELSEDNENTASSMRLFSKYGKYYFYAQKHAIMGHTCYRGHAGYEIRLRRVNLRTTRNANTGELDTISFKVEYGRHFDWINDKVHIPDNLYYKREIMALLERLKEEGIEFPLPAKESRRRV